MYRFRRSKELNNTHYSTKLIFGISSLLCPPVSSMCLFPPEFEGEYIFQNAAVKSDVLQYSSINITADWISPYGQVGS